MTEQLDVVDTPPPATRAFATHTPKWQRFRTKVIKPTQQISKASAAVGETENIHPYQRQYSHVYHQRLAALTPRFDYLNDTIKDVTRVQRILELTENVHSIAVGTLVKECTNPKEETLHPASQCRASDALYLEDESGRVALSTDKLHEYPTGVVVAVQGTVGTDGIMQVQAIHHPELPVPVNATSDGANENLGAPSPMILLVSGLACGDPSVSSLPRDMLVSFLEGSFGVESASRVARVVVCGGLVAAATANTKPDDRLQAVRELDAFLFSVAALGIPIDIFPGADDPTTANWPQRPLHSAIVKTTHRYLSGLLYCTPNPYAATHDDQLIVGTDGLNVHDLQKHVTTATTKQAPEDGSAGREPISELQALQKTLEWSHLCPTGPHSVPTAPFDEQDPMVLMELPNLYFAGNCQQFATTRYQQQVRLVCVPKFGETGEAVLVHLKDDKMKVELLRFEEE